MTSQQKHEHDLGLQHDLRTLLDRRRALTLFGGAGLAVALAGCASGSDGESASTASAPATTPTPSAAATTAAATTEIPEETGGPFPADGSNGVNVLTESGIVRRDITTSFGSSDGVAGGVPLTVKLKVLDLASGAAGYAGAAIYLWHCDREGRYSMYSDGVTNENYLRGVQVADADGNLSFTTIFPAAYSGRWPHIHFEVYPNVGSATSASGKLRTSQLALPEDVCEQVYATDGYTASVGNLAQTSLESDNVFSDGYSLQMATVTGSTGSGLTAALTVPV